MILGMAGPALATPVPNPVTPGAFCKNEHLGKKSRTKTGDLMVCMKKAGEKVGRWRAAVPAPTKPTFKFGNDKVRLSSRRVVPGGSTAFTVTCPNTVTITGNGYTRTPLTVTRAGSGRWTATGKFRSSLPDPTTATVVCKGFGSVKFSTSPEKGDTMTPKPPKVPTGRIDTGDGSMSEGSASPLAAAGLGALLIAGIGAFALRRSPARERS
jgi:hypothetical protein